MRRLVVIALISLAFASHPALGDSLGGEAGRISLCQGGSKVEMPGEANREILKEFDRDTITLLECPAPTRKCQCGSRFTCCPSDEKCVCIGGVDPQCAQ